MRYEHSIYGSGKIVTTTTPLKEGKVMFKPDDGIEKYHNSSNPLLAACTAVVVDSSSLKEI